MVVHSDENHRFSSVIDDEVDETIDIQKTLREVGEAVIKKISTPPRNEGMKDTPGTSNVYGRPPAIRIKPRQKTINARPRERVRQEPRVIEEATPMASYTVRPLNTRIDRVDYNEGAIQTRTKYLNYTKGDLHVTNSDNITFLIEPILRPCELEDDYDGYLEIQQETLLIGRLAYPELKRIAFSDQRDVVSAELKDLRIAIQATEANPAALDEMQLTGVVVTRTWRIEFEEIFVPNRLYVEHLGIYLSATDKGAGISFGAGYLDQLNGSVPKEASGFCLTVVDNEDTAGKRYMYAAGQIMTFAPIKDPTLRSGVYICSKADQKQQTSQYMSFSEAQEKIKLYDNKADAATNGDPEHFYNMVALEKKHENEMLKIEKTNNITERTAEMEELKHEFEKEIMQLRAQQERERAEREREMADFKKMHEQETAKIRNDFEKEKHDIKLAHEREMNAFKQEIMRQEETSKDRDRKRKKKQEKEDRKLAKKRAREERAYKLQLEEEERKRNQRLEEEDRLRKQRLEEEERERKKRMEEEDRQRKQRQEEEDRQRKAIFEAQAYEHTKRLEDEENRRRQYQENSRWMREQDRMIKQDIYEDRSYRRKDSSEFLKQIPLYVTAGLAAFTAYTTYQNSRSGKSIYDNSIIDI